MGGAWRGAGGSSNVPLRWGMLVREVCERDFPGVVEIENHEIVHGVAHFGTTPNAAGSALAAWERVRETHPFVVCVVGGVVVGYAKASVWKEREAYRATAEIGVYVREGFRGRGIGQAMYAELFPRMRAAGLRTLLAGIALPNEASVALHERYGMRHAGTLARVGMKFGRWIDVGYWSVHIEGA